MGFFRKLREKLHDDWCSECASEMETIRRQLYALPTMTVGHYVQHEDPEYYKKNLVPVTRKAEIPTGMYACGITAYRCPQCGHRAVKMQVFLPVRDVEKPEQGLYFEHGEMDDFLWSSDPSGKLPGGQISGTMDGKSAVRRPY